MDWCVSVYSLAAIGSDIVHTPTLLQDFRYNIGTWLLWKKNRALTYNCLREYIRPCSDANFPFAFNFDPSWSKVHFYVCYSARLRLFLVSNIARCLFFKSWTNHKTVKTIQSDWQLQGSYLLVRQHTNDKENELLMLLDSWLLPMW